MRAWLRGYWGLPLALLYLLVLEVPLLGRYGLWFDEIFSVVMSRQLDSIVQMVRTQENNMLLHYLLLLLWQPLGDGGEVFLRSSSVILVLLSLWPLHAATRQLAGATVANSACLLYAGHFLVLEHIRACRGYSLALLMAALVLWLWVRALQSASLGRWLLAGAAAGLGVWAHYFSALVPVVLAMAMLWHSGLRQPWRLVFAAGIACLVVALPIVLTRPPDGAAQIGWADVPTLRSVYGTVSMLLGSNGLWQTAALKGLFVALMCALLWRWRQGNAFAWRSLPTGIAIGLVLVVGAVLAESFIGQPLFVYRFFTPLVPLYCVVLAVALQWFRPWLRYGVLAILLALSAYETWKPYVTEPVPLRHLWKPLVQQWMPQLQPGDVILVYPAFLRMPVDYYLDRLDPQREQPRPQEYVAAPYRQGGGVEPAPNWLALQRMAMGDGRIWLLADEKGIPSWDRLQRTRAPDIRRLLRHDRQLVYQQRYQTMTLERYDPVPPAMPDR